MQTVEINSTILRRIREQRRLSIDAVATYTSIKPSRLRQFELGERSPTFRQTTRLAETYGIKTHYLFGESIPNIPPPPTDFRDRDLSEAELSPRGYRAILFSERVSAFATDFTSDIKDQFLRIDSSYIDPEQSFECAAELRGQFDEWFGVREKKLALTGDREVIFLSALRLFIEAHGRVVRTDDAPPEDFKGFYFSPGDRVPNLFVNRKVFSKKAQLFTLAHEYAHALFDAEGISDPFISRNKLERLCNKFAANFIAPESLVKSILMKAGRTKADDPIPLANFLSRHTLLSNSAAVIRLKELDYMSEKDVRSALKVFGKSYKAEKELDGSSTDVKFGWPHTKRIAELGNLATFAASRAVRTGQISPAQVAKSIRLSQPMQERAFALAEKRLNIALS